MTIGALLVVMACPYGMVPTGLGSCIDELPWLADDGRPLLGLSAVPSPHDPHDRFVDLEAMCDMAGARLCRHDEWAAACAGTRWEQCPAIVRYRVPDWRLVARRDPFELERLNQSSRADEYPVCVASSGARMMGAVQEWVRYGTGYAFSRGFWSRAQRDCRALTIGHDPGWHDYATGGRCCRDL